MVSEESNDELHAALAAAPTTRAFLRTDGKGRALACTGLEAPAAQRLAERLDLAIAGVRTLGRAGELGAPATLVFEYAEARVFAGIHPWGEHVVVVGDASANVGLYLSRLHRLLARDVRDREVGT